MSGVFISNNAPPRIGLNQYARNGLSPVAEFQNLIAERVGYAVRVRAKMAYRSPGLLYSAGASLIPASSASERTRWRFAAHAAPYARYLFVRMWQARQSTGTAADCYSRLRVVNGSGTLIGDAIRHFGSGTSAIDTPSYFGDSTIGLADTNEDLVEIPPDEAYFGTFADFNSARLVAACVWEVAFDPNTDDGYPDVSAGSGSPIYDKDRADAAAMANAEWAYKAQPLWHWSVETDVDVRSLGLGELSGSLTSTLGALTLVATGTVATSPPAYQAQSAFQISTGPDITATWPAHATGDVALLIVGSTHSSVTLATASGFASVDSAGSGSGSQATQITSHVYWCRATSGSMAAPVVDHPGVITDGFGHVIGDHTIWCAMITFRGCVASGTPYEGADAVGGITTPATLVGPISTTVPNTLLVGAVVAMNTPAASGAFSSWAHTTDTATERFDEHGTADDAAERSIGVATVPHATASSMGTITAAIDGVGNRYHVGTILALKP